MIMDANTLTLLHLKPAAGQPEDALSVSIQQHAPALPQFQSNLKQHRLSKFIMKHQAFNIMHVCHVDTGSRHWQATR